MRNRGIAAAVVCAALAAASAGPLRAQWAMTFGRAANDQPGSILIAPDGGAIVSGYSQYTAALAQASEAWLWVLKLDREGLIAWQHIWDCSSLSDVFNRSSAVVAAPDGGCLLAATYKPRNRSDSYALLVRLSPDGIVLWQKAYGFGGGSFVGQIYQVRDACTLRSGDGVLVVGSVQSGSEADRNLWAARFDWEGRPVWQRQYSGPTAEEAFAVKEESDGTFYIGGRTLSFGAGGYDFWVLNVTGQGDVIWQKTYGGAGHDAFCSLDAAPGGGCVLAGETLSFGELDKRAWVLKLDRQGNVEWQKSFGVEGGASAEAVRATPDGGAAVAGNLFQNDSKDLFLLKLSAGGTIEGLKTFGEIVGPYEMSNEYGLAIAPVGDAGYIVGGASELRGDSGQDFLLVEVSPDREGESCRFLTAGAMDEAVTDGMALEAAAVVSPTFAVPSGIGIVEGAAFDWQPKPICPTKKKGLRR